MDETTNIIYTHYLHNNTYEFDENTNEFIIYENKENSTYEYNNTIDININTTYIYENKTNEFNTFDNNIEIQCYETCEACIISGNNISHNCLTCKSKYSFKFRKNNNLNCYEFCHNNSYNAINDTYLCLEEPKCFGELNKLIPGKNNLCIDKCIKDDKYKYEFLQTCYEKCPEEISKSSKENKYLCELNCIEDNPYENIKSQQCIKKCDYNDMFNNKCKLNYIKKNTDKKENLSSKIMDSIKNGTMKEVLSQVISKNETMVFKEGDSSHLISTLDNNLKRTDFSSINFGD